jgi:hypothetical protein
MKTFKLVILASTICLSILLPLFIVGINPQYTYAYETILTPSNITEVIFDVDNNEIKKVYDLSLVNVIINGNSTQVLTNRTDIYKLLNDMGVVVDNSKKIVSTSEDITNGTVIRVITVGKTVEELNINIPFKSESINTKDIPYGTKEVAQAGVLGVRTQQIEKIYEDGKLISQKVLHEAVTREPVKEIIKVGVLSYGISDLEKTYGYNCPHWYSVVDVGNYTDQEKQWLKFVMYCESGCNAESDKNPTYKGLYQWLPKYWNIFFPKDNIYDGYAQIENTVWKIRHGVNMKAYWPDCHSKYVARYGEFVR